MSPRRALITAIIMTAVPMLIIVFSSNKLSAFGVLIISILINWPLIRWLDDRQWYREWKRED